MSTRRSPELDAHHQLLDRQIIDVDGRMVAKVDDVELEERPDGRLAVTALLTGPGALGPRLGGALGGLTTRAWSRLTDNRPEDSNRIDFSAVAAVETVIRLAVGHTTVAVDGFEEWVRTRVIEALPGAGDSPDVGQVGTRSPHTDERSRTRLTATRQADPPRDAPARHRLNDLLGMHVRFADGTDGDQVTDVRLVPGDRVVGTTNELVTEGLIIGRRRPGTLLGYDRNPKQGPWLVRVIIRYLHRHTGYLEWGDIDTIDWVARIVQLRTQSLRTLQPRTDHP
jgi:sporulation protein YlmC with PRC-barrel domain